jgi:alpha-galactosidase
LRSIRILSLAASFAIFLAGHAFAAESVWLSSLEVGKTQQDWGKAQADKSVDGNSLTVAGTKYEHGLGTHAASLLYVNLNGGSTRFSASVGVDDEVTGEPIGIRFLVIGDGRELWKSGVMKKGQAAEKVDIDVTGVKTLVLIVENEGDNVNYDHADWADAKFEVSGEKPVAMRAPREEKVVLTPKPPATPRINGPRVFGVRPGRPFLYSIPATGDRPMEFDVDNLPSGLTLDAKTGQITGVIKQRGEYVVVLRAVNGAGKAQRKFKIVCGDKIALTPPLGWNSWNCFAGAVDDAKVRSAADAMVRSGLTQHGWTYINIDDCWEIQPGSDDPKLQGPPRDANGMINTNKKFPNMKALCDYIHGKGLKAGIYSSPGPLTCAGFTASYKFELQDAQRYAQWGFDYLKYDWCSYGNIAKTETDLPKLKKPYTVMQKSLGSVDRDIIYSLCQYGMGDVWKWGAEVNGNCWRTTGDINDSWGSMAGIGFSQNGHEKYAGPGHWNDPDMLVVGMVGWGNLHPTNLTPNEQYTHISLWCLLASPLLIGCDMTKLDDFTLGLLTNDEVLEVNQDPLGKQAARLVQNGSLEVWAKEMQDHSIAVGLFNRGRIERPVTVKWSDLGISGKQIVRDLWRQKDLGTFEKEFTAKVPRHGVVLIRVRPNTGAE